MGYKVSRQAGRQASSQASGPIRYEGGRQAVKKEEVNVFYRARQEAEEG